MVSGLRNRGESLLTKNKGNFMKKGILVLCVLLLNLQVALSDVDGFRSKDVKLLSAKQKLELGKLVYFVQTKSVAPLNEFAPMIDDFLKSESDRNSAQDPAILNYKVTTCEGECSEEVTNQRDQMVAAAEYWLENQFNPIQAQSRSDFCESNEDEGCIQQYYARMMLSYWEFEESKLMVLVNAEGTKLLGGWVVATNPNGTEDESDDVSQALLFRPNGESLFRFFVDLK
jgi:hypothetical protein